MNKDQGFTTVVSFVLMLASVMLGWFTFSGQFPLPKTASENRGIQSEFSEQNVVARLWEDPLQAVQAQSDENKPDPAHSQVRLQNTVHRKLDTLSRICLLVVPIPATPFSDDRETRLRLRYSIQMAMADGAFTPEDRDHLGCVKLGWPGSTSVHPCISPAQEPGASAVGIQSNDVKRFATQFEKSVAVPYEWFQREQAPVKLSVLLLWLPEQLLGGEPLCRLAYLREALGFTHVAPGNFAGLFVVGPRSSDTLRTIAASTSLANHPDCRSILGNKLCFFSCQATAPDTLLGLKPTISWSKARQTLSTRLQERIDGTNQTSWSYFRNFIAPDDQVTDLLVQELDLRGVDFHDGSTDQVLILAEADTFYGRSLPTAFEASVKCLRERAMSTNASFTSLIILLGNALLAGTSWIILRRAARHIKTAALESLNDNLVTVEGLIEAKSDANTETARDKPQAESPAIEYPPKLRKLGLQEIKRRIEEERRGAFARWIQDPAFLAMLLPTGMLGILSILFQTLFGVR